MNDPLLPFVQTLDPADVIPPAMATRLAGMTRSWVAINETVDAEARKLRSSIDRMRKVQSRYAALTRRHVERTIAESAQERLALLDKHETATRDHARIAALSLYQATRQDAMASVEDAVCDVVGTALERIIGSMPPRERIEGVVRIALREATLREPGTLRVPIADRKMIATVLNDVLGPNWQDTVTLEADPSVDADTLELTTLDGTTMIAPQHQIAVLVDALHDGMTMDADLPE